MQRMSGPKQSNIVLDSAYIARMEAEHKARIVEAKRLQDEAREKSKQKLITTYKELDRAVARIISQENIVAMADSNGWDQATVLSIMNIKEKYMEGAKKLARNIDGSKEKLDRRREETLRFTKNLEQGYAADVAKELAILGSSIKAVKDSSGKAVLSRGIYDASIHKEEQVLEWTFNANREEEKAYLTKTVTERIALFQERISQIKAGGKILGAEKVSLDNMNKKGTEIGRLENEEYAIKELEKMEGLLELTEGKILEERREWDDLYGEYLAVTSVGGFEIIPFEFFETVEELEVLVSKLKQDYAHNEESKYISNSFQEVMQEMGYDLLSSEILERTDLCTEHDIYAFDDDSAINAYISDNGALMLEVVNLGNDSELTEADRDLAYREMNYFCDAYPEIIERLGEKGIHLRNQRRLPPNRALAKKINRASLQYSESIEEGSSGNNVSRNRRRIISRKSKIRRFK